ncbi:hypothetical protein ScPMuIL_009347 [Solemya velum]
MCLPSEKVRQIGDFGEQNSGDFEQHYDMGSATSSDDTDGYVFSVTNGDAGYVTKSPFVETRIFDKPVKFLIDTGATVNIIDTNTYNKVCSSKKLHGPTPVIYGYASKTPLPVKGYFSTDIDYKDSRVNARFYVVDSDTQKTNNLLSANTAQSLNLVHFAFSSTTAPLSTATPVVNEFCNLFDGEIGKIKGPKIKLHIDESLTPVTQRHRRVPFHVRKDVESELERLEKMDIIEKIQGPTPWINPVVVVPKKSEGVRLCIDMREANKAIKREKHPMPTLDLISDLNGSKVFSKLDMSAAYHQLELDKDSRYITTFTTHVGLRRYKRLFFGVNAASELFQNAIAKLLCDVPGAKNLSNDVIVHGKTQEEHDTNLRATLKKLSDHGAKLNRDKCVFSVRELVFRGHIFCMNGVSVDPEKIKTIMNSPPPSVSEVRSFLGMTQYVSRYIPDYATLTEPLRNLTKKDSVWTWSDHEQKSFDNLKQSLTSAHVMSYFDPDAQTEVLVNASPVGLGAILTQKGKIICYASRALTDVEQRYSQTDREMLAVVYGVEHFHLYLYGSPFTLSSDHKPLMGIVNSRKPATARMERWRLRLMPYEMTLKYRLGRDDKNPADYISRHPQNIPKRENAGEAYVNYICNNTIPRTMTLEEQDDVLQKVVTAIQVDKWNDADLKPFKMFRDELYVTNGVILRDHRLIIPASLQQKVITIAHQAHQGIVKTKQLIREKVWFPGIDKQAEEAVKSCIPCMSSYPGSTQREPINPTPLPSTPCRYPEAEIIQSTSAKVVLPRLETIFARQGIPKTVKTDNGPPCNGSDFSDFAHKFGFRHRKITPLWPEANGEAERFMATLNKYIRSSTADNKNWKTELQLFLRQYRATPHSSIKISPFEALTGRKMNIGFPEVNTHMNKREPVHTSTIINDAVTKEKMKIYADNKRHTKLYPLGPGDQVLIKQKKRNKLTPPFDPRPCTMREKNGSMITAQSGESLITRNSSHFKRLLGNHPVPEIIEEREDFQLGDLDPRPPTQCESPSPPRCLPRTTISPRRPQSSDSTPVKDPVPSPVQFPSRIKPSPIPIVGGFSLEVNTITNAELECRNKLVVDSGFLSRSLVRVNSTYKKNPNTGLMLIDKQVSSK